MNTSENNKNINALRHGANGQPDHAGVVVPPAAIACQLTAVPFLNSIWRSPEHSYQVGVLGTGFQNLPVSGAGEAVETLSAHSKSGCNCFHAPAAFRTSNSRKADNAVGAWAFWEEFDTSIEKELAGKGYASVNEAEAELEKFHVVTCIPLPTHRISSGGGLHVYFALKDFVPAPVWTEHARMLKELHGALGLRVDPSRTSDIASMMRTPGMENHKYDPPRPVVITYVSTTYLPTEEFLASIRAAHTRFCAPSNSVQPVKQVEGSFIALQGIPDMGRLVGLLNYISPDVGYDDWLKVLMALHTETGGSDAGLVLATNWSKRGQKFKGEGEIRTKWASFRPDTGSNVTIATLVNMAKRWKPSAQGAVGAPLKAESVAPDDELRKAERIMQEVVEGARGGSHLVAVEDRTIEALSIIKRSSLRSYEKAKILLKDANAKVATTTLDRLVQDHLSVKDGPATHHAYAKSLLDGLAVGEWSPVAHDGTLYTLDADTNIWVRKETPELASFAARLHDGQRNCTRSADYRAIAQHAVDISTDVDFFTSAPTGLACREMFYRIKGDEVVIEPLTPDHRQRVRVEYQPTELATPLFDDFLHDTFKSEVEGEKEEQVGLLQEVCGAAMTGISPRYQRAVLFYDKFGRSGKGTTERIMKELVPDEFIVAVSPFNWEDEYYLAQLVGARLNVVGELPDGKPIPANSFKTLLGGDLVTGRHPAQRPIKFRNEAAHVFMSNNLITSTEHGEAFFARWLVIKFPNSRLRLDLPQDPNLAERIIASEMPGIAHWALQGAKRVLAQGGFSKSRVQDEIIATWRRRNSSLEEFVHEECTLGTGLRVNRATLYRRYKTWCEEAGRKPFSKAKVKEVFDGNIPLGIQWATLNGDEIFRGVTITAATDQQFDL